MQKTPRRIDPKTEDEDHRMHHTASVGEVCGGCVLPNVFCKYGIVRFKIEANRNQDKLHILIIIVIYLQDLERAQPRCEVCF